LLFAAHLDPEILIVDEVLAVGDARFQNKCIGKMQDVSFGGRTVIFVSHNLGTVKSLCTKGVILDSGKVIFQGSVEDAVVKYSEKSTGLTHQEFETDPQKDYQFRSIKLKNDSEAQTEFSTDENITIKIEMDILKISKSVSMMFFLNSAKLNTRVFAMELSIEDIVREGKNAKRTFELNIPRNTLRPGLYFCEFGFLDSLMHYIDYRNEVGYFTVYYGKTPYAKFGNRDHGLIFLDHDCINIY